MKRCGIVGILVSVLSLAALATQPANAATCVSQSDTVNLVDNVTTFNASFELQAGDRVTFSASRPGLVGIALTSVGDFSVKEGPNEPTGDFEVFARMVDFGPSVTFTIIKGSGIVINLVSSEETAIAVTIVREPNCRIPSKQGGPH